MVHVVLMRDGDQLAVRHLIRKIPVIPYIAPAMPYKYLDAVLPRQPVYVWAGGGGAQDDMAGHALGNKGAY